MANLHFQKPSLFNKAVPKDTTKSTAADVLVWKWFIALRRVRCNQLVCSVSRLVECVKYEVKVVNMVKFEPRAWTVMWLAMPANLNFIAILLHLSTSVYGN